jgi:NADH dehydrogenase FAD-containing subunit
LSDAPRKVAVLLGAGHAHLHIIQNARRFTERGHRLVVLAPPSFYYSGLATGVLGGAYEPDLDRVDIAALAARSGAEFVEERAARLDREARELRLEDGASIAYDALSINLGSEPPAIPGDDDPRAYSVKPIPRLFDLRYDLEADFDAGRAPRVVIAGGGATAAEIAVNISGLATRCGGRADITLATAETPLAQLPQGAAIALLGVFAARGIAVRTDFRVASLADGMAIAETGEALSFDRFVNATGLHPRSLPEGADLPLAEDGAMLVDGHLRSPADPRIHGGGDGVAVEGHALPRIGVYAIRQAPVLLANLLASLDGTPARAFRPQRQYLWIINLGDGTALAMRGGLWWRGRLAFGLKDRIDLRFLRGLRS